MLKQFEKPAIGEKIAVLKTNKGDIKIRLFEEAAPLAVENFISLIEDKYYDGIIFHRVIENFMIQGETQVEQVVEEKVSGINLLRMSLT